MADSATRSLLTAHGDSLKPRRSQPGYRGPFKTPLLVSYLFAVLIGCVAASAGILVTSHEDPVDSWTFQPSVWLSLLSSIYAVALGGLFLTGVAVTWWRSIAHGTTMKILHFISAGASLRDFFPACKAGGHARRVAIAGLLVLSAKVATGPLMQRATRSKHLDITKEIDMSIYIAKEIPDGYYGTWEKFDLSGNNGVQDIALNGDTAFQEDGLFCPGKGLCSGMTYGAGLNYACTSENRTMDLRDQDSTNSTVFRIDWDMVYDFGSPMLHLITEYTSSVDEECTGTLTTDSCYLVPATVWYPISIQNSTLKMDAIALLNNLTIVSNYTSSADIEPTDLSEPVGPLVGTYRNIGPVFRSEAILYKDNATTAWVPTEKPYHVSQWPTIYAGGAGENKNAECPILFRSPTRDILLYLSDYMFRSALSAASQDRSEENLQTFTSAFSGTTLSHITDFRFLAASVAVMLLGIAAATSLLWGWWQLNRYVTLSPLETAKAFGGPILLGAGPEQEATRIVKKIGHERVAHDGNELVWNGTVYTTGVLSPHSSVQEMDTLPSGQSSISARGQRPGHSRNMSSTNDAGYISGNYTPPFEHNQGSSTRRWDDGNEEADVGRYNIDTSGRQRSGSISEDRDSLLPMPLRLTPGRNDIPELPPIPPTGSFRAEGFSPTRPRIGLWSPMASQPHGTMATGVGIGTAKGLGPESVSGSGGGSRIGAQNVAAGAVTGTGAGTGLKRKLTLIEEISKRAPS